MGEGGLLSWQLCKESTCQYRRCERHRFDPWVGKMPWRRAWQPTPVFLRGESHGQRCLVGYGPEGCKEPTQLSNLACTHIERETNNQNCRTSRTSPLQGIQSCFLSHCSNCSVSGSKRPIAHWKSWHRFHLLFPSPTVVPLWLELFVWPAVERKCRVWRRRIKPPVQVNLKFKASLGNCSSACRKDTHAGAKISKNKEWMRHWVKRKKCRKRQLQVMPSMVCVLVFVFVAKVKKVSRELKMSRVGNRVQ